MKKTVTLFSLLVMSIFTLSAQEKAASGVSAKELAKANNPLANMKAFNIQNYYAPSLSGMDAASSNTTYLRYASPMAGGKLLVRATLPIYNQNMPTYQASGLGGLNIFATYSLTDGSSPVVFGAGPMVTTPNITGDGHYETSIEGKVNPNDDSPWSLGGALVFFSAKNPRFQYGGLVTYEHSINAETGKTKSMAITQPFMMVQLGKGNYLRSAASQTFDFENERYYVPVGLGVGKVTKIGSTVINFYVEPQYTAYSNYAGAPNLMVYTGFNFQFMGGGKK